MKTYRGFPERTEEGGFLVKIEIAGFVETLNPRPSQQIINHSPDGFNWGYGGSGPHQLALALLLDVTGNKDKALKYYHQFTVEIVAGWPDEGWTITDEEIMEWIDRQILRQIGDDFRNGGAQKFLERIGMRHEDQ